MKDIINIIRIYIEIVCKFKGLGYEIKKDLISITVKVLTIITIMLTGIKGFID